MDGADVERLFLVIIAVVVVCSAAIVVFVFRFGVNSIVS